MYFLYVPKAVSLKYPSPLGPNPEPGVPTVFAFVRRWSKKSHDDIPSGVSSHTYGAFTPPLTENPASL